MRAFILQMERKTPHCEADSSGRFLAFSGEAQSSFGKMKRNKFGVLIHSFHHVQSYPTL